MGSVCCVAAKDRNGPESGAIHNPMCSPPWRLKGRVAHVTTDKDSSFQNSNVGNRGISVDVEDNMSSLGLDRGPPSESGSFPRNLATPASHISQNSQVGTSSMIPPPLTGSTPTIPSPSDVSLASPVSVEVQNIVDSLEFVSSPLPKPSCSTSVSDLPSAHTHSLPPRSISSRRARGSPGQQLFKQVSDSQTWGLKSPNNNSTSEGRSSFGLSNCSTDFATGSHYASSEGGWSMNAFCELVAQSQKERLSFDSEHLGSGRRRLSGCSSSIFSCSPSVDQQTCGNCSKLLTERSSSVARFDLPIAAILACGHVYHADCLETMTSESEKYDPTCPICTIGETQATKLTRKALKAEAELQAKSYRRCKNRVVDSYARSESEHLVLQTTGKQEGKALKMDPSSSTKGSTSKSFMKWHLGSISSKWSKPLTKDSTSKKSFWSRHSNKRLSHSSSSIEGRHQTT